MTPQDDRQVLIWTVVITAAITLFAWVAGGDIVGALVLMPIVMTVTFWSMRISLRLSRRARPDLDPNRPPPPGPDPTPPSSERPEHARRRRERRRPRGRRR